MSSGTFFVKVVAAEGEKKASLALKEASDIIDQSGYIFSTFNQASACSVCPTSSVLQKSSTHDHQVCTATALPADVVLHRHREELNHRLPSASWPSWRHGQRDQEMIERKPDGILFILAGKHICNIFLCLCFVSLLFLATFAGRSTLYITSNFSDFVTLSIVEGSWITSLFKLWSGTCCIAQIILVWKTPKHKPWSAVCIVSKWDPLRSLSSSKVRPAQRATLSRKLTPLEEEANCTHVHHNKW